MSRGDLKAETQALMAKAAKLAEAKPDKAAKILTAWLKQPVRRHRAA